MVLKIDSKPWNNWFGDQSRIVKEFWLPATLDELVEVVKRATDEGQRLKAVGSSWSYQDIAVSDDWVVSLENLNKPLTSVVGGLNPALLTSLPKPEREGLVHFEAGIQIYDLNNKLAALGRALPTMGGYGGQTLAGAISTSTHGADFEYGPLPDLVRAIHLVADGGREIWIESASRPITDDARLAPLLPHAKIIRDDRIFDAARVSVGRFGVIYSYVLATEESFHLAEHTLKTSRAQVLALLRQGITSSPGTELAPLLASLPKPPAGLGVSSSEPVRFVQIAINSQQIDTCYVTRRWKTQKTDSSNDKRAMVLCDQGGAQAILQAAILLINTWIPIVLLIPFYGLYRASVMEKWVAALTAKLVDPHTTAGEALVWTCNAFWESELAFYIPKIAELAFDGEFMASMNEGRRGRSDIIMAGVSPSKSMYECYRADSVEPVFPSNATGYLDFVDLVLTSAPQLRQVGYISLRFSASSRALLSMHNVPSPRAVAIEVTSLKGLAHTPAWINLVHALAVGLGGRPHWGQRNFLTAAEVRALYGANHAAWRDALAKVSVAHDVFRNHYTVQRDLEPSDAEDQLVLKARLSLHMLNVYAEPAANGIYSASGDAVLVFSYDRRTVTIVSCPAATRTFTIGTGANTTTVRLETPTVAGSFDPQTGAMQIGVVLVFTHSLLGAESRVAVQFATSAAFIPGGGVFQGAPLDKTTRAITLAGAAQITTGALEGAVFGVSLGGTLDGLP